MSARSGRIVAEGKEFLEVNVLRLVVRFKLEVSNK